MVIPIKIEKIQETRIKKKNQTQNLPKRYVPVFSHLTFIINAALYTVAEGAAFEFTKSDVFLKTPKYVPPFYQVSPLGYNALYRRNVRFQRVVFDFEVY